MKQILKTFSLIIPIILFGTLSLKAQDDDDKDDDDVIQKEKKYDFTKKKEVNKSFNVNSNVKLDITNSFGTVDIHVWEKNEIKVDVIVEVSATTEAVAQKLLDRIDIKHNYENGKAVTFKTETGESKGKDGKNEKSSMRINYTVSMPSANPLEIENSFGTTNIPDYKGEVNLSSKFGKLNTGNLSSVKKINVEFGKANLGNLPGGDIVIKFSKASIAKIGGSAKINLEFCSNVRLNLDNNLNGLDLKLSYSTVNLRPLGDIPGNYTIATSFGSFKNKTDIKFTDDNDDNNHNPQFDIEYTGKSGSGSVPVKIKSSFSTIILGEATEEDMKGKHKDKRKTKNKSTVSI